MYDINSNLYVLAVSDAAGWESFSPFSPTLTTRRVIMNAPATRGVGRGAAV